MSELLKNQKFGVEVEFTGITREMAANAVREVVGGTISVMCKETKEEVWSKPIEEV